MKKHFNLLFLALFFIPKAQEIKEVLLFQNNGRTNIKLVANNILLTIDTEGNLLSYNANSIPDKKYQTSPLNRISSESEIRFGNMDITYYDNFHDYESGKLKSIGNLSFTYYDKFHDYDTGKLKSIGSTNLTYYDSFHDYDKGKLKSVGDNTFSYYDGFHDYDKGKLKSINNTSFEYFDKFSNYKTGKLKSIKGNNQQIKFNIIND